MSSQSDKWTSAYTLVRDKRILNIQDSTLRYDSVKCAQFDTAVSVIVIADDITNYGNTILGLGSIKGPIKGICVCKTPDIATDVNGLIWKYKCTLPPLKVFTPERKLTCIEAITAGLQSVDTDYVALLQADLLHWATFDVVVPYLKDYACVQALKYFTNAAGWANDTLMCKPFWQTTALLTSKSLFQTEAKTVTEIETELYATQQDIYKLNKVLVFGR